MVEVILTAFFWFVIIGAILTCWKPFIMIPLLIFIVVAIPMYFVLRLLSDAVSTLILYFKMVQGKEVEE